MDFVCHLPTHLQGDLQERPGSAAGRSERAEDTALLGRPTLSFELTPTVESMGKQTLSQGSCFFTEPRQTVWVTKERKAFTVTCPVSVLMCRCACPQMGWGHSSHTPGTCSLLPFHCLCQGTQV